MNVLTSCPKRLVVPPSTIMSGSVSNVNPFVSTGSLTSGDVQSDAIGVDGHD